MSTEVVAVVPSTISLDAARAMSLAHVGSALVLEGDRLVGIFTERDILRALEHTQADAARVSAVSRWMTADPVTIGPEASVGVAMDLMLEGGFRHLPVVEGGAIVGVVSMRDLARSISKG